MPACRSQHEPAPGTREHRAGSSTQQDELWFQAVTLALHHRAATGRVGAGQCPRRSHKPMGCEQPHVLLGKEAKPALHACLAGCRR